MSDGHGRSVTQFLEEWRRSTPATGLSASSRPATWLKFFLAILVDMETRMRKVGKVRIRHRQVTW
jgi:hypothetical protein